MTKKVATIVRPIKIQLHFNLCFISKYISIRSNRRWLLIIWAMSTYLQIFPQLYYYCSRVNYINYNKKLCMTSPEAVVQRWFVKKLLLKLHGIHREIPVSEFLFNKIVGAFRSATLLKRDSNTGVFLWFCEIFKNTYFQEILETSCRWKVYLFINQRAFSQIFFQILLKL